MSIRDEAVIEIPKRRRRAPDEARREALVSARQLLINSGPTAVTLKAVGDEIGVTHANLIHHFGSAAGLQSALMESMVRDLADALDAAVTQLRSDTGAPRALVDAVFDAFDKGGAGRLAAWIALSGDLRHLEPVRAAVHDLVQAICDKFAAEGEQTHRALRLRRRRVRRSAARYVGSRRGQRAQDRRPPPAEFPILTQVD
jgi:AcrR family transcriptional regulator